MERKTIVILTHMVRVDPGTPDLVGLLEDADLYPGTDGSKVPGSA